MSASMTTLSVSEDTKLDVLVCKDEAKNLQWIKFDVWDGGSRHEHVIYFHDEIKFLQALEQLALAFTDFSQMSAVWPKES